MKLFDEESLLNIEYRKKVIEEIEGSENQRRKREHLKRYEIYKDKTKAYVIESLISEGLKEDTVCQMSNRAANISICKKIVNKIARTYAGGVTRQVEDSKDLTAKIDAIEELLDIDEKLKKSDRYRELHKNCLILCVPEKIEGKDQLKLKIRVLAPWQYDVIEDGNDREMMRAVIFSDYINGSASDRNYIDEEIADSPRDENADKPKEYIWWSDKYHFTTDGGGEILPGKSEDDNLNPIERIPAVNNAEEQDGFFWAIGGDDLVDGSILVNKIISDMLFIAYYQGFGQVVATGKDLPKQMNFGPNNAICLNYDEKRGDPKPSVDILSSNPPLDSWMKSVELYVALLLSTNNLSPANVSIKLDTTNFPSGIAMIIEMSEAIDDIEEKQKDYKAIERQLWDIIRRWHNIYFQTGTYDADFKAVGMLPDDMEISIKFNEIKPVVTEKDKLENLKARKDLGINKMAELVMIDNPDLSMEQAEEKLKEILAEKLENLNRSFVQAINPKPEDMENAN